MVHLQERGSDILESRIVAYVMPVFVVLHTVQQMVRWVERGPRVIGYFKTKESAGYRYFTRVRAAACARDVAGSQCARCECETQH